MKAKVSIYKNDGEGSLGWPVKLILSNGKKTRRKTIGYTKLKNWDERRDLPGVSHPDYEDLIGSILDIRKQAATMNFKNTPDFNLAFKKLLNISNPSRESVSDYFDVWINKLKSVGRNGTADEYKYVKNQFNNFAPGLMFADIDSNFLERFKAYKSQDVSNKTLKNYLSVLRALWNKAALDPQMEIPTESPFKNVLTGLHTRSRRRKNRYLDRTELLKLKNGVEQLSGVQKRAALFSLLQFYLGGANLKDVYYLKANQFYKDRVMLSRSKLGQYREEYDVKVFPEALKIIKTLGDLSEVDVFPYRKDHLGYKTFRRNHYRDLIKVQEKLQIKLLPINEKLNSNTFRHSFATLAKFEGIDPDIIRELMGHERNDIDTVYKDKYPEFERDTAHFRIINLHLL